MWPKFIFPVIVIFYTDYYSAQFPCLLTLLVGHDCINRGRLYLSTVMERPVPNEFGLLIWCIFRLVLWLDLKRSIKDIEARNFGKLYPLDVDACWAMELEICKFLLSNLLSYIISSHGSNLLHSLIIYLFILYLNWIENHKKRQSEIKCTGLYILNKYKLKYN